MELFLGGLFPRFTLQSLNKVALKLLTEYTDQYTRLHMSFTPYRLQMRIDVRHREHHSSFQILARHVVSRLLEGSMT